MNKEKQIEEMASIILGYDLAYYGMECDEFQAKGEAEALYNAGYRKADEVALEAVDNFQRAIRHIFLNMCNGNDYNTINLLQIDSAIETLYDTFIAELKKKYKGDSNDVL